jgi:hypothetical protein
VVREEHLPQLNSFIVKTARALYPLERVQPLTVEELAALPLLLFSRQLWFSPRQLIAHGVPVSRIEQTAGQVVVLDGCIVHWGMVADAVWPHCLQEAINYCPLLWLTRGLERLVKWMGDLQRYLTVVDSSTNREFRKLICSDYMQRMLAHHAPAQVMVPLLKRIRGKVVSPSPPYDTLDQPHITVAEIDKLLAGYSDDRVVALFERFASA